MNDLVYLFVALLAGAYLAYVLRKDWKRAGRQIDQVRAEFAQSAYQRRPAEHEDHVP
ncbi:hypothetical protein [Luteipulveratus halotolerans]|uniref:hypothetical protein n=1 Tax=Luteipulveratus halotolerans TaxID=1631356 RepID=UPI0012FAECD2|nr:hypothetical protein [Luteipulveratus halotolerans]